MSSSVQARWRTSDAASTQVLAESLGRLLGAGDVLVLTGGLGAGKTTFTQGLARGLGVRGPITSPTFVVAREHPSLVDGPPLVHVDAYRLSGSAELDDLDLDAAIEQAVTVVEWGAGLAEALNPSYLEVTLEQGDAQSDWPPTASAESTRVIVARGHGPRWVAAWPQIAALA